MAAVLEPGDLVVLAGPLGVGKTFLVRALSRGLGWPASEPVTSPAFALVHEYATEVPLLHADLYRLETAAEVLGLGLDERRLDGAIVLVEWGENYVAALGGDALMVSLSRDPRAATISGDTTRTPRQVEGTASGVGPVGAVTPT